MEKYYHLQSSPLLHCPLFRNDVGRRFFLNHLALVLIDSRVKIYVYCLMDNHIHFLVSGEENDIIELFAEVKIGGYINSQGYIRMTGSSDTVPSGKNVVGTFCYISREDE